MALILVHRAGVAESLSPYRLPDDQGREVDWANAFLDAQRVRQLSLRSLRAYAYDLLHFTRWWYDPQRSLRDISQSTLLDYVRHQLEQQPRPATPTINHRLAVVCCCYHFHYGEDIPSAQAHFRHFSTTRSPFGYGRGKHTAQTGLRLRQSRRIVLPLSHQEVIRFWQSFRHYRDFAIVGLMLLDGLRSCEVLALRLDDLELEQGQLRVTGKGNRQRVLPLPPEVRLVLERYLQLERPATECRSLFVSLQGSRRGQPMTVAGLRSLFRHHRLCGQVPHANPHRLRHSFGADMVRCGISLPALQHLMGHSRIHTTMLYVQLSPQDVWREFRRASQQRQRLDLTPAP